MARYDSQVNYNFPLPHPRPVMDGDETMTPEEKASAAITEKNHLKLAGGDGTLNAEEMRKATEKGAVESNDAGMGWGRGGQTETFRERGAESIPPAALSSVGIAPEQSSTTSPTPNEFNRPVRPDRDCSEGLWNAGAIFNNTKIG